MTERFKEWERDRERRVGVDALVLKRGVAAVIVGNGKSSIR